MIRSLGELTRALAVTWNSHAALGRLAAYAVFPDDLSETTVTSADGELSFDFLWWHSARAVHTRLDTGNVYSVEFLDVLGDLVHKICLPEDADLPRYFGWVQANQWKGASVDPFPRSHRDPCTDIPKKPSACIQVEYPRAAFSSIIRGVIAHKVPIRASVGNGGAVQRHVFAPYALRESDGWMFFCDREVGMHVHIGEITRLSLSDIGTPGAPLWALAAFAPGARPAATLEAADPKVAAAWNSVVLGAARNTSATESP